MTNITNTPKSEFESKEKYLTFVQSWKENYKNKKDSLTKEHFLIYAIFRNKDWRKCFTPCTRKTKLMGGQKPHQTAFYAHFNLKTKCIDLSVFGGNITDQMIKNVIFNYLPNASEFKLGEILPSPYKTKVLDEQNVCVGS